MLTFEEKLAIIEAFPQLERRNVSLGRVNFHFEESLYDKKTVVYHLHPNGNGFVYAGQIRGQKTDAKGMVNIRDYSAEALRSLIQASIDSLSHKREKAAENQEQAIAPLEEVWIGEGNHSLKLVEEGGLWNVYDGPHLESAFESYKEAERYLLEEGFTKKAESN